MIKLASKLFLTVFGFLFALNAAATTIIIVNNDGQNEGFNSTSAVTPVAGNSATTLGAQYFNVFQAAAEFWETKLDSDVPIRVQAQINPLICNATGAQLGGAGPLNAFLGEGPNQDVVFTVAQANSLSGEDLDPTRNDVDAVFNGLLDGRTSCLGGVRWWLGIDSPAIPGTVSLYDTVLHEIGHGIGFLTFVNSSGQRLSNGIRSFNDTYMLNLFDSDQNRAWANMTNAQRASSSINTGGLVWSGSSVASGAEVFTGGRRNGLLRVYAPNPFEQGSSVSHWDTSLSPDELMEPFATFTSNACATILALNDMGWRTKNECIDGNVRPIFAPIIPLLLDP